MFQIYVYLWTPIIYTYAGGKRPTPSYSEYPADRLPVCAVLVLACSLLYAGVALQIITKLALFSRKATLTDYYVGPFIGYKR